MRKSGRAADVKRKVFVQAGSEALPVVFIGQGMRRMDTCFPYMIQSTKHMIGHMMDQQDELSA